MPENIIKPNLEAEIKGLGIIDYISKPYDESLNSLKSIHSKPITGRDLAYARINAGYKHSLSENGGYIRQGIIYILKEKPLFVFDSPIISSAVEATENHRKGEEFTNFDVKKYQELADRDKNKDPKQRKVLISDKKENYSIPTSRFNEDELALWLFKDMAEDYGKFLQRYKINEMPIWLVGKDYVNKQKNPFARQLWLRGLGFDSELDDDGGNLDCGDGARGVRKESGEASAQKTFGQKQLDSYLRILEEVKSGKVGTSKLEKVINGLSSLKQKG